MKTILVTGGAGFVGSNLCKVLLEQGHRVIALDDLSTGFKDNVEPLLDKYSDKFKFTRHDVTIPYVNLFNIVDEIYNLACPASPPAYQKDPLKTISINIQGAYNAVELAKKTGAKILQASTSEVYGDPAIHPQPETYWGNVNPIGPRSCYDEGKRIAETIFMESGNKFNIDYKIIRIFNTYGPNMDPDDGRVVSNFITQALLNEDITIYGDGTQTRSFCYVDDLVQGIIKMMATNNDEHGPINLGNPGEFTMNELAEEVLKLLPDSRSKVTYKDLPKDDPMIRQPTIYKAKKILNWEPRIKLQDGLVKAIKYFSSVVLEENV